MEPIETPFVVLIDSAEQHAFDFQGIVSDARDHHRPLIVRRKIKALGRHPIGLGDYSIEGFVGNVAVERKSVSDFQGTLLGWDGRRDRFKQEVKNLSQIDSPLIVVEGTLQDCLSIPPQYSSKPPELNAKILLRSCLGLLQDFRVPVLFCDTRRLAEVACFRFLQRAWRKDEAKKKRLEKLVKSL